MEESEGELDRRLEGDAAETVIRRRDRDGAAADESVERDDDTVIRLIEPFVPSRSRLADRPALLIDSLLPQRPGSAVEPPSRQRSGATARFALRIPGVAKPVGLEAPVVIGRRPGASRVPESTPPRRIVVPADRLGVSGRHARIEQLGESVVLTDLGSSNGTVVHLPAGPLLRLRPGESCVVLPDSIIGLGDGIDIAVVAVDPRSGEAT